MSRPIDADALIEELNNTHFPGAPYVDAGISIAIGKVYDAPTIVPERERGKWICEEDGIIHGHCSCCGFHAIYQETDVFGYDFCPNCGARLEE